jgi:hypothetical protein
MLLAKIEIAGGAVLFFYLCSKQKTEGQKYSLVKIK